MKINDKMISIPPYISTTWHNICSVHMKNGELILTLLDGEAVNIPSLSQDLINTIFSTHSDFLDKNPIEQSDFIETFDKTPFDTNKMSSLFMPQSGKMDGSPEMPFKVGFGSLDNIGSAMQHNPAQAHSPDLPPEVLTKIASIAKIIAPEDPQSLPKAEPHCNCVYCQIARTIHKGIHEEEQKIKYEEDGESVPDNELEFRQWDIQQTGDKLFTVVNRLDSEEKYNVHLGQPVGCTCGQQGCEHILAILKS